MNRKATTPLIPSLIAALCLVAPVAQAELTQADGKVQVQASSISLPARGATMAQVEAQFGAPATRHNAVGAPPITRWDYPQFSVYFENTRVIHAVAAGR